MKLLKVIFSCIVILLLIKISACDSIDSSISNRTITFSQSNQQFSIVPFYLNMSAYINKAKENRAQINRIYKAYVYNPIWNNFAAEGECSFLAKNIKKPITDLDGLEIEVKAISNSEVEGIVKKALLKASKILSGPNTTIYLQVIDPSYKNLIPSSALDILKMGIHADTYGSGKIFISIDPTSENWKKILPRVVAHEYHHSVWIFRNFETVHFSLLDCLILEGRAEGFADLVYSDIKAPWPDFLDKETEYRVWQQMKHSLNSRDEQIILKMIVGDGEIPFLSVYSIGHKIMQEFLKNNPETSLIQWTDMEPVDILLRSKYEEKFN